MIALIVDNRQNTIAHSNHALSMKQLALIPKIVKETVIAFNIVGAFCLSLIMIVIAVITYFANPHGIMKDALYGAELWFFVILIFLISFAMFVSFGATRGYYIMFCGKCERAATRYWQRKATEKSGISTLEGITLGYDVGTIASPRKPVAGRKMTAVSVPQASMSINA